MEAERIFRRLTFLGTLAQLWKMAAVASATPADGGADRDQSLAGWLAQAMTNRKRLIELLAAVHRYRIPPPRGTQESLVEYDHRRSIKETLLEQIIAATVETGDAGRLIRALMAVPPPGDEPTAGSGRSKRRSARCCAATWPAVRTQWREMLVTLSQQSLLYVALARGGNPLRIVASRSLQGMLRPLAGLPAAAGTAGGNHAVDRSHPGDGIEPSGRPRGASPNSTGCSRSAARPSSAAWCWPREAGGCPRGPPPAAAATPS